MEIRYKKVIIGFNVITSIVILLFILIMVNYLAGRHYKTIDITTSKIYTLTSKTKKILHLLKKNVDIYVITEPQFFGYSYIRDLLFLYEQETPKINVEYLDIDKDKLIIRDLIKRHRIARDSKNIILIISGRNIQYIKAKTLFKRERKSVFSRTAGRIISFRGEQIITSAILSVSSSAKPVVYFTTSHSERSIYNIRRSGLSHLRRKLVQQNIKVRTISLITKENIPQDCKLLIIAGPRKDILASEQKVLKEYLANGGNLLVLVDSPIYASALTRESRLSQFLRKYGIVLEDDIVIDLKNRLPFFGAETIFLKNFLPHPITEGFGLNSFVLFSFTRSIKVKDKNPNKMTVFPLVRTSRKAWGETNLKNLRNIKKDPHDINGPLIVAVAAESKAKKNYGRIIVIGNSFFITNSNIKNMSNSDFMLNCVNWLLQQYSQISIPEKIAPGGKILLTKTQLKLIFILIVIVLPLLPAAIGLSLWFYRRKRKI